MTSKLETLPTSKAEILKKARQNEITPREALRMIREVEQYTAPETIVTKIETNPVINRLEKTEKPKRSGRPRPTAGKPGFFVAEQSGWCSIYFYGLRRPVTIPAALCEELISDENLVRFRKFLDDNRGKFRNKVIQPKGKI